jgi:molybdopterin-containing oxidoreductase family iron-sulfur binding subunit
MGELVQITRSSKLDTDSSASDDQIERRDRSRFDRGVVSDNDPSTPAGNSHTRYWRSLEELADSEEFLEIVHREFPENASEWTDDVGRRTFLKLMGASLALGGLTACTRQPAEQIAPYVKQPEEVIPGRPLFFATAMPLAGFGTGLLVKSNEGRPTKVEGNPDHPASLGATDLFSQASLLGLYDPDRSQTLTYLGEIVTWSAFLGAITPAINAQKAIAASGGGKPPGLRLLTGTITSPTLAYQIRSLLAAVPGAKWHQYEPAGRSSAMEGSKLAFGQYANAIYHFEKADVVLSLDADFLSCGPGNLRYSRDFADKRRLSDEKKSMNRLYVIESTISNTGSIADHRLAVRPSDVSKIASSIASRLLPGAQQNAAADERARWVEALVADLKNNGGRSIVIAGDSQPPELHALAHAMNAALGNVGSTVSYTDPVEANPVDHIASIRELCDDIDAGRVEILLILGGNPVYNAPVDLNFPERLSKVPLRIHLSQYSDETSRICQWHIPEAHYLESWSDVRAFDGSASIVQPLIAPLYQSCKSAHEVLSAFLGEPERKPHDIVREYWQMRESTGGQEPPVRTGPAQSRTTPPPSPDFERFWRKSLHDGVIANSAGPLKTLTPAGPLDTVTSRLSLVKSNGGFDIVFKSDPTIFDGRFANNGWLQELPKPIIRLTWDNAALVSPATAVELGIATHTDGRVTNKIGRIGGEVLADMIEIQYSGNRLTAPALIVPGHPDKTVTLYLGYGRTDAGHIGSGTGFNAYALRTSSAQGFATGAQVTKIGGEYALAVTQLHHAIDAEIVGERDIVRAGTLAEYLARPSLAPERSGGGEHPGARNRAEGTEQNGERGETKRPSLFPAVEYKDYAWGMAIDMSVCTGCTACVVACVSENNTPVVGKEQVLRRREMQWLRVDAYYKGPESNPQTYFQPVPCMHCENAPCELVCPVAATVHSAEGLNDMVYNRCVGTRYCSNNCPYKVRRFNFLLYQDFYTESLKLMRNPDVSVRSRGVMEKCTYCVQRIQRAKIASEREDRPVRDGEIATACEAACPTRAIVFGNINDSGSRVAKLKAQQRNYSVLGDLNTKPRTTYLAVVKNPNPELEGHE